MIISEEKKFVFIHNPKVAGSSIRKFLSSYDSFDNYFWNRGYINGIDHAVDKPHIPLNDLEKTQYYQYLNNKDFFVFGFVRNPYERIYSAYLEKCRQWEGVELDFNEFIKELDEIKIRYDFNFIHFCPQHYFFYNGNKCLVDFIGKMENIDIDFNTIKSLLNVNDGKLKQVNKSSSSAHFSYFEHYNEESVLIVNQLYEKDFLFFDYPMVGEFEKVKITLKSTEAFKESSSHSPVTQLLNKVELLSLKLIEKDAKIAEKEDMLKMIYTSKYWKLIELYRSFLKKFN